ncbi:cell envelope integrity protein TolA [Vibrio sp.]|nr:cell envelope integrity protein TolA [Vibrio sp.]
MKLKKKGLNNLGKPIIISLVLHIVLIGALIFGGYFSDDKPQPSGSMVQAVVIDPDAIHKQAEQIKSQRQAAAKEEQDRLDKLRQESERLEANRKVEEERIRQLKEQQAKEEQAAREAEQARIEQQKQREAEEAKAAAEKKAREEQAAKKAEQERLAKEKAAKAEQEKIAREKAAAEKAAKEKAAKQAAEKAQREKAAKEAAAKAEQAKIAKEKAAKAAAEKARKEQERLKRLAQEKKEREDALSDIFDGLESENQKINSARGQYVASEVDKYGAIYKQLIQQNLRIEDSFKGRTCKVNLKLIPTGTGGIVGGVSVLDGDSSVCAATKRAIAQVDTFPMPKDDPDVVAKLKNINLMVVPE